MIRRREFLFSLPAAAAWTSVLAHRSLATPLPADEEAALVAIRILFRVGSQEDPPGKEGLAALTAAMVAEGGTKELTYQQVLEKFYPMAAGFHGACRKEVTVFSGEIHRDNLEAYTALIRPMIMEPRFASDDFERLQNDAIEYLSKTLRANNDEELGKWALQLALYRNHPYGHVDGGTVKALKAITLDDVKAFHKQHFTHGRLSIGLSRGISRAFTEKLGQQFEALPTGEPTPPKLPRPDAPQGLEITIVSKPADSTAISLGFPIDVTRADDDFYPLAVANSYLGEHRTFNGKLMQDLRGKRGLNYGDYSYIEDFIQDGGSAFPVPNNPRRQQAFTIWIRPVPHDKAAFALRAALWEYQRLLDKGISQQDFEATRSFLRNYSKLWVQTRSRALGYAMDGQFYGRKSLVEELEERLPKMTVDQVNAAVRKHLKSDGFHVAIVTKDAEGLRDALASGKPTPLSYDTKGTPEDVLAEDRAIEALPLKNVKVKIVPVQEMFES